MKLYDISQEVFSCEIFPGDPFPEKKELERIKNGSLYNLSAFSMCAHNGTHVDAPFHFIHNGKTIDEIPLDYFIGYCTVIEHNGILSEEDALGIIENILDRRLLFKGTTCISKEAALIFANSSILLIGNESQTIGNLSETMEIHQCLLSKDIVLLEGIRLSHVPAGRYLLNAAPLNLAGFDGSPCRAVLIDIN
ncbi:MAG: cyclase family protein [Holdemanella sp.]|nr:cyclase family protein [Holdemanella sp.]